MARPAFDKNIPLAIEHLHRNNPKWKAPRIRQELFVKYGKQVPSSSYIRNKLKEIRDNEAKGSVLDQPWSFASLTANPVPYEIIPWLSWLAEDKRKHGEFITIRDALWIARLSVLPSEDKGSNRRTGETEEHWETRQKRYLYHLLVTSNFYANQEIACERVGLTPVDTGEFDSSSLELTYNKFAPYYFGDEKIKIKQPKVENRWEKAWFLYQKQINQR